MKGYYGLAPWVSAPGDLSSILFVGYVHFLLRRDAAQIRHFRLVSEEYVSGLRIAEASHFLDTGKLMKQNLIIC